MNNYELAFPHHGIAGGLTKRELFAAMVMAHTAGISARTAVERADALIIELKKKEQEEKGK